MYISVNQLANAINNLQRIKPVDIVKVITVLIVDNSRIHYQVIDKTGNISYYNENSIPVSIVKLMNCNKPDKTWTRENRQYFQYRF